MKPGLWCLALLAVRPAAAQDSATAFPASLDEYVARAISEAGLPGAALAVVKDGRVIITKGYGLRELGRPGPIDARTIFDIASVTKSFTAAAAGTLVDRKRLGWDDPVRRFLPELEFPEPFLTANVTLRDLLSHRTGLAPTNRAPFLGDLPRPDLIRLVRRMEIAEPFRARYVYSNIGFTLAGEAAAVVAGTTWEKLITERLLLPLGMTRTTADYAGVAVLGNVASGHALFQGIQRPVPRDRINRVHTAPAGAVQSSAADLATWMLFHLGDGSWQGRTILSADVMAELHAPHVVAPTSAAFRKARQVRYFAGYGLGWQVWDYRGQPLLWHSGNGAGQVAYLAILPQANLGVAVLVNSWKAGVQLNAAIANRIFDHYLGDTARDYVAEWKAAWTDGNRRRETEERELEAGRKRGTSPGLPLAGYAGAYRDQLDLLWRVSVERDTLRIRYAEGDIGTLTHWHHDTFRVRWSSPLRSDDAERPLFVSFTVSAGGTASRLVMDPGPFRETVVATRDPGPG